MGGSGVAAPGGLPGFRDLRKILAAGDRQQLVWTSIGLYRLLPGGTALSGSGFGHRERFISLAVYVAVIWLYFRVIRICVEGELVITIFITLMMVMTGLTISEIAFSALSR